EGGAFVEAGRLALGGALPTNTWGGQLSGGRLHGYGFLAEAIRQLRGECGPRQVASCEVAVVANGGGPLARCMLLTRRRPAGAALRLAGAFVRVPRGVGGRGGGGRVARAPRLLARGRAGPPDDVHALPP